MTDLGDPLERAVRRHVPVLEVHRADGALGFVVADSPHLTPAFRSLRRELAALGYTPLLRRRHGRVWLHLVPKPPRGGSNRWLVVALFLATLATTFATGFLASQRFAQVLQQVPHAVLRAGYWPNPWLDGLTFSAALMSILLVHELGHKLAARVHGIEASGPYFIPFPPLLVGSEMSLGTMGAVIFSKEPAPDRDGLFDLGASGPVAGLVVAAVVLWVGLERTVLLDLHALCPGLQPENCGPLLALPRFPFGLPWVVDQVVRWRFGASADVVPYLDPLLDAAVIGLFVTAVNLLPASSLDGGHVTRALLGERWHRWGSYLAVGLLFLMGLWLMAVLLLFLLSRGHPGPMDDLTPPSAGRLWAGLGLLAVFLASLPWTTFLLLFRLLGELVGRWL
ncbi:MAG: site-2 protease family protein [Armatimonadota bacterium]|nr:site-2 protease family protein [Armatimonadota bacterium]MDW8156927.1 site-2 protease family protein [Armatimonadota bacterium]